MNIVVGEKLIHEDSWSFTKRKVLSLVSSVFDPLGWVSPLTVRGKIFLQTLWKEKMCWDQTLNTEQVKVIREIIIDLQNVDEFSFPDISYTNTRSYMCSQTLLVGHTGQLCTL